MAYDRLLPLSEICDRTGKKRSWLYLALKAGEIKAVKVGCSTRIYESELNRFLANLKPAEFRPNASRCAA